jgi:hypothetical protein
MGIFHETIELVNRTSKPLEVIYDGQRTILEPNYDAEGNRLDDVHNILPKIVIPYALNQNVVMGSEDAIDPSSFQSLVGVVFNKKKDRKAHSWHDCTYLEQTDKLTRTPLEDVLDDPNAKIQVKGRKVPRSVDAAMPGVPTPFDSPAGR